MALRHLVVDGTSRRVSAAVNDKSYDQAINAFLWRFFGVLFLLFVMVNSFKDSSKNELGERIDELGLEMEQSSERMNRATGELQKN